MPPNDAGPPPENLRERVALFNEVNRYARANGMTLEVSAPGQACYRMTVQNEHLSSPGTCHGGVIAGLMDSALGAAALSLAFTRDELVATVEFKMNYLRPVRLGDRLVARGEVEHTGQRLVTARATIYRASEGSEEPVASGMGTFNAYPIGKSAIADLSAARPDADGGAASG